METLNTLKYANRARNIKNKVIKIIIYYEYYYYAVFTGTLVFLLDCSVELISMVYLKNQRLLNILLGEDLRIVKICLCKTVKFKFRPL